MKIARMHLGIKFSIAVTVLIGLIMSGVTILIINYQKDSLRQSADENNLAVTRNFAHDAAAFLVVFDPLRLDELVQTVSGGVSSAYALITDNSGMIVAQATRSFLGSDLHRQNFPALAETLAAGREFTREYRYDDIPIKEFSVPIRSGNRVLGLATIGYSTNAIDVMIETRLRNLKKYLYLITGIMLPCGIAGALIVSHYLTKPLRRLKDKMVDVQAGNLDVVVENPRVVKCWERMDCDRQECPSYGKVRCWATAGTFCHGVVQGTFAQKIGDCRNCVVYKESCGDEIQELVEVFNQMVKDLRYNLQELERANTEKSRMERLSALGEMAATVAHETKNPLNSIRIAASYLKKNFHGEILSEFLSIIEEEVMRLNDITSSFLGFSKTAPLALQSCDVNTIVRSTVELIRQEATDRNIEVIVLTDEDLPRVSCDFSAMKQALLNLLLNAIDASINCNTISLATERKGDKVRLFIQDAGSGIPQDQIANIFKPFYTTKTRGSGLGLAIVDRIIKEHRGTIEVESEAGKGTRFTIELPIQGHG